MDTVTLNYEEYLLFTGWGEYTYANNTMTGRLKRLTKMGVHVVSSKGRAKKAEYILEIPKGFWRMLLIKSMWYTEVGADYISYLIDGRNVLKVNKGNIVLFDTEIYLELAEKHGATFESVKSTCIRIRNYLMELEYIRTDSHIKSHRVKESFLTNEWLISDDALHYDQSARDHWTAFIYKLLTMYQKINPTATALPMNIFGEKVHQFYSFGMAEKLDVNYYQVAKKTIVTDSMIDDIEHSRLVFLKTKNLSLVKEELFSRQRLYKEEKKNKDIQRKEEVKKHELEQKLTNDEWKEIKKQLFIIEGQNENKCPPRTVVQEEHSKRIMDELFGLFDEDLSSNSPSVITEYT